MRNPAFTKPRRPAGPSMLTIPNRDRAIAAFKRAYGNGLGKFIDIELERRETLQHGEVCVLTVFVEGLRWPRVEHLLPKDCTPEQIEGGAEIIGDTLRRATHGVRRVTREFQFDKPA